MLISCYWANTVLQTLAILAVIFLNMQQCNRIDVIRIGSESTVHFNPNDFALPPSIRPVRFPLHRD